MTLPVVLKPSLRSLAVLAASFLLAGPVLVHAFSWQAIDSELWSHLGQTLLPEALSNTAVLLVTTVIGSTVLGIGLAWSVVTFDFPGRNAAMALLALPLALPKYLVAFVFYGALDATGFVRRLAASLFGRDLLGEWHPVGLLPAALVFVLTIYPYVYLAALAAFRSIGRDCVEAATVVGASPRRILTGVLLPSSWPWLLSAAALAAMETTADFGAVSIFGVETLSTLVYRTWRGHFSLQTASQIASILALIVIVLLAVEKHFKRNAMTYERQADARPLERIDNHSLLACLAVWLVVIMTVVLPLSGLLGLGISHLQETTGVLVLAAKSAGIALLPALVVVVLALGFSASRNSGGSLTRGALGLCRAGYGMPGTVIAVGVLLVGTWISGLLGQGSWVTTPVPMILGLATRFFAVGWALVATGALRIPHELEDAARSVGASETRVLLNVRWPLLVPFAGIAFLMVWLEALKEMPITLMTRPFGWDTLAVKIFEATSEGLYEKAAVPAMLLGLIGGFATYALSRVTKA